MRKFSDFRFVELTVFADRPPLHVSKVTYVFPGPDEISLQGGGIEMKSFTFKTLK
jgi:hypothetical protein